MKRSLTFLLFTLFCAASLAQNKIELNLNKGQVYSQKSSTVMGIKQKMNSVELVINMTINGTTTYKVTDLKDDVYDIDVVYKTLYVKSDLPGGKSLIFDSEKQDKSDTLSMSMAMMKDKPFHMKMNRQGKVLEISNIDNLYSSIFATFPQLSALQKQKLKQQIEQSFGEKAFRNNLQNVMAFYPRNTVIKGSKWGTNSTFTSANMEMQVSSNFTLDDVNESQYVISGTSKMTVPNADVFKEINGRSTKANISGNVITNMKINKKTGWIEESVSTMDLKGAVTFKADEKMPQGMTIPMEVSGKTTLTSN
jgi:hypothetical protein